MGHYNGARVLWEILSYFYSKVRKEKDSWMYSFISWDRLCIDVMKKIDSYD